MEKNYYENTLENYALIDNKLASAQLAIGESSNLAQICLSYTYNFSDQKYQDYVCILSVLAQVAIDNAKRSFDIDLNNEIKKIKEDMDIFKTVVDPLTKKKSKVVENGYPKFWRLIRPGFSNEKINSKLKCPMNYLCDIKLKKFRSDSVLPMEHFFVPHELKHRYRCKKIEELIEKFSLKLAIYNISSENESDEYLVLRYDFDKLIEDIRKIHISNNYLGVMSWLIDRAFCITVGMRRNHHSKKNKTDKNKSILLKVLYEINPDGLLKCFSKGLDENRENP